MSFPTIPSKMRNSFKKIKSILNESSLPEFPSLLPRELRTREIEENMEDLYNQLLHTIPDHPEAIPLLGDYIGLPVECDLVQIAKLLENERCVDFSLDDKPQNHGLSGGFRTASGKCAKVAKENQEIENEECKFKKAGEKNEEDPVEKYILDRIRSEIIESKLNINWDDVVGLSDVKRSINEIVLWPMQRPDLFKGLRGPPKGLLLFGPPGTGKTMIGKCVASQVKATFFSISASSLTSKWMGDGEKMVRALFYLARKMQPSVIFVDEIDSLLSQRSSEENEGSRRIKTEFLVQFDGVGTADDDRILLIGATNRPQEIDEAARRRLVKRIYVPLPENEARVAMINNLIKDYKNSLTEDDINRISRETEGYSGSDIFNLCREASLEPLRELGDIQNVGINNVRNILVDDFIIAMKQIRKSVSVKDLDSYKEWNLQFGSAK